MLARAARSLRIAVLALAALATPSHAYATTPWEVAVLFLGSEEPEEYQQDIDSNILELARTTPNALFKLSLYRELPERSVQYFVDPASKKTSPWDSLFFKVPAPGIRVPGRLTAIPSAPGAQPLIRDSARLGAFLNGAFSRPGSRRILVVYGHGLGHEGLQQAKLKEVRAQLEAALPKRAGSEKPLDILWLDACFMANLEAAYELRGISSVYVASEDSEFSSGAPFDFLDGLGSGPDDVRAIATELAERFVESYSYTRKGSQHHAALSSSATISVVDTARLDRLVSALAGVKRAIGKLTPEQRRTLVRTNKKYRMDRPDLADLGSFLLTLRTKSFVTPPARDSITQVLSLLGLNQKSKLRTSPRVMLRPPAPDSLLVYGYADWTRGFEADTELLSRLPAKLQPTAGFTAGPRSRRWPTRKIHSRLILSPFTVGMDVFNSYFADPANGHAVSAEETFTRRLDFVAFQATNADNPLLYTGYTQGIGQSAERYSGLSVLDPAEGEAGLTYLQTEFAAKTDWANF